MELLTQNGKMQKTSEAWGAPVYNWSIPAYKSSSGALTCPMAGACAAICYAQVGHYRYNNVKTALEKKLALTKSPDFVTIMMGAISEKVQKCEGLYLMDAYAMAVRIHDSGDFYSKAYLQKWVKIIKAFPTVVFYAYTKSVGLIKGATLPKNFRVIFSYGGKQDALIDTRKDRHAKVFQTVAQLEKARYSDCSGDDLKAIFGPSKVGLVYHGIPYKETNRPTLGLK